MAAVTSTIVALGGLGLSAAQAIKANKDMKIASKASQDASTQLKGIKEQNAFKNVQVPTLGFDLAQEAGAQRDAQALSAIQGAGAAGVIGGVGQLAQVGQQGDLELAASAQEAQYNRDLQQANAEQGIEARRGEREFNIGMGEKQDAELRRAEAAKRRTAAINSMAKSAGSALTGVGKILDKDKPTVDDPYGYKNNNSSDITENKDWKGIPYPYTPTEKPEPFDLYDYLSGKK